MTKTNIEVVQGYIDVLNRQQFDHVFDYCSADCVYHVTPYIGLGFRPDASDGKRVIIGALLGNGPATGMLQVGDEIVRVADSQRTWSTFDEIKNGFWAQGIADTPLTVTVRRGGKTLELHINRGKVGPFDHKLSDFLPVMQEEVQENWSDMKAEIQLIFEKDDLVAFFATDTGTYVPTRSTAMWSECNIFRIKNGKITEMWGLEDTFSELNQIGYRITEPHPEPA